MDYYIYRFYILFRPGNLRSSLIANLTRRWLCFRSIKEKIKYFVGKIIIDIFINWYCFDVYNIIYYICSVRIEIILLKRLVYIFNGTSSKNTRLVFRDLNSRHEWNIIYIINVKRFGFFIFFFSITVYTLLYYVVGINGNRTQAAW